MAVAPTITAQVAGHIAGLTFDALPGEVVEKAKAVLLDTLGCQLACSTLPHGRMAVEYARRSAGPADATVIGTDLKTSAEHAGLVNGIFGHGHEIDAILELFGHAAAVLVPTVLAVAERERASGRALITALVAGYDVAGRIAKAGFSLEVLAPRNFQQGSTGGSIAAAAAAGNLIGLDQRELQAAFGVAGEQACGLQVMRTETGHMNKSLHMGVGSRNGIASAYLAQVGYGGAFDVLDPPWSLFEAFVKGDERPDEMTRELGVRYEILAETFKRYASGRPTHTAIAAMHGIMADEHLTVDELDRVEVRIPTLEQKLLSHSLTRNIDFEYNIAVAAMDGRIGWEQYALERQADPALIALRERVTSVGDPEFDRIKRENVGANPSQVTITTRDGRVFTDRMVFPPGHPRNPLGPGELEQKFMDWSTLVLPEAQAVRLREAIADLEHLDDVNALGDLLRI